MAHNCHKTTTKNTIGQNFGFVVLIVSGSREQDTGTTEMQPDFLIWKIKVCILMHLHFIRSRACQE